MLKYSKAEELQMEEIRQCSVYCPHCKHTIVMMVSTEWCICSHCKHKVKNNSKAKFKYELIKAIRKVESEEVDK